MKARGPRRPERSPAGATQSGATPSAATPARQPTGFISLGAVLLSALLFQWPALRAPFFADDWLFLDQCRQRPLAMAIGSPDPIGNFFRPLGRVLWFWVVGHASGESAAVFHLANVLLWLGAVALLWLLARRLASPRAATLAAALFAITYAADVPVMWASGAQDLLALVLALGSLLACANARVWLAALLLFLAPFAKETALVAVVPAVLLVWRAGESPAAWLRRAWPLGMAVALYAALAALVISQRHAPASGLALSPWGPVAALAGPFRVLLGLEWRSGGVPWVPFALPDGRSSLALALAAVAVLLPPRPAGAPRAGRAGKKQRETEPAEQRVPRGFGALAWVAAGAIPVMLVAPLWSAYYFLFAIAGVALYLGLALERAPAAAAFGVVLLAGIGAQQARALDEFSTAPSPWSAQSHVSRFYLERGMSVMSRCVQDIRGARPTLPPRSTILFGGIPAFASVQVGDGPLVRGLYRDTTLHSFYVSTFNRALVARGPLYMLLWDHDAMRLVDRTNEPDLWLSLGIGYLLNNHLAAAIEAFGLLHDQSDRDLVAQYGLAMAKSANGDSAEARELLSGLHVGLAADAGEVGRAAARALAAGDTNSARNLAEAAREQAIFDPVPHMIIARIHAGSPKFDAVGVLEAFAACAVAPQRAAAWRNWASVQQHLQHFPEALVSLDRYFVLEPGAETSDPEAVAWRRDLRDRMPGGRVTQRSMKEDLSRTR